MTTLRILLACVIMQTYVNGAPNFNKNLFAPQNPFIRKNDASAENNESTLGSKILQKTPQTMESNRQKRMFNYHRFDFPSFPSSFPFYQYPSQLKHDATYNNGIYTQQDPFAQIYQKVQDIASSINQPNFAAPYPNYIPSFPPTRIPQIPFFVPVFYIPQSNCNCNNKPANGTEPGIDTRFPIMDDTNQIWGVVVNETIVEEGDGSRPISFEPIPPNRPINRPSPPVEHGSSQAGEQTDQTTTTTTARPLPPLSMLPSVNNLPSVQPETMNDVQSTEAPVFEPTSCDGAVLNCCHQRLQTLQNCVVAQGCPELLQFENPCDSQLIFDVIQKFTAYYTRRLSQQQ